MKDSGVPSFVKRASDKGARNFLFGVSAVAEECRSTTLSFFSLKADGRACAGVEKRDA